MSDQNQTQIILIDDALADLRDGKQTVEQIGQWIGGMWQHAIDNGDETAASYYDAAWGLANALALSNDSARELVQAVGAQRDHAIAQRDEIAGQRDQVAAAYSEYQTAVINMDFEHPEAGRQIKLVHSKGRLDGHDEGHEAGYDAGIEDGYEAAYDGYDPEESLIEPLSEMFNMSLEEGEVLSGLIFQSYTSMPKAFLEKVEQTFKALVAEAVSLCPDIMPD